VNRSGISKYSHMKQSEMVQDLPRLAYSVRETAHIIGGVSEKSVYRLLQRGLLTASPALRHKIITAESIQRFMGSSERRVA